MFVVALSYKDIARVDALFDAHREFLREQYGRGAFLMGGPMAPRTGAVIIATCEDRAELDAVLALDPLHAAGVAHYAITEFTPTMTADALASFREE